MAGPFGRELRRLLRGAGFVYDRPGKGDHEIWRNTTTNQTVSIDAGTKSRHTANDILRDAGLPKAF